MSRNKNAEIQSSSANGATRPDDRWGGRRIRWGALLAGALLASVCITYLSGTANYEERLTDIAASRGLPMAAYKAAGNSPKLKELFLEAAADRELTGKLELGLLKYGDRARAVFEMFGDDAPFQEILRQYGEGVVPVVDYFMETDMLILKGGYWAHGQMRDAWLAIRKAILDKQSKPDQANHFPYGPRYRGIYAIEAIHVDGHHFLGQFVLDKDGHVQRVQTDRILETIKKIFAGGLIELESKYDSGDRIQLTDIAWAGADLLSVFGVPKALKFLGGGGKAIEEAAIVRRTTLMGRGVLLGESVGKHVAGAGAKLAAVYLVVRHPSLLSGVFRALGLLAGLPPWISILIGWWGAAFLAMLAIIPMLRGATLLITPIRWIAQAAAWMVPKRSAASRSPT